MNRRVIAAAVVVAVIAIAALAYYMITRDTVEPPSNIEDVGGKYNVTISSWTGKDYAQIEYTDETGTHSEMYFSLRMRNGLDWIRNNTPENATFLCWWDYGHMIKGYAERNVIVRNPSQEILNSVANPSSVTEFDSHEKILDVATAFTTDNATETSQIMKEYGATYIHVSIELFNTGGLNWVYTAAGLNWRDYLVQTDSTWKFTEAGNQTMFAKLLENRDTGFTLVYQDDAMKVYRKLPEDEFYMKINSSSMQPTLKVGDTILVKKVANGTLIEVGDIIVFKSPRIVDEIIVHRVANKELHEGLWYLQTKGDANLGPDTWTGEDTWNGMISEKLLVGKVI